MAAIYADAAAFGYKVLSQEPLIKDEELETIGHKFPDIIVTQDHHNLEDFIVIAEFSEVTGPIPILTIPSNIAESKTFDINNFIMKIMSVDYQANPGGHFQTCDDVQVLSCEERMSAYVHYTMLHDLQARGWVRPFCIAYISSNSHRLQRNFDSLRKIFLKMTEILKYNNCLWFKEEINASLETLREKQVKYFNYKKREVEGIDLGPDDENAMEKLDIDLIVHQYTEYKHLLHTVELSLVGANYESTIECWKQGLLAEIQLPQVAYFVSRHCCENHTDSEASSSESFLKAIPALCPWGFAAVLWSLCHILKSPSLVNLEKKLTSVYSLQNCRDNVTEFIDNAVRSTEYLNLLLTPIHGIEPLLIERSDSTINTIMYTSANEATTSSSYHSVAESLSDLPKDMDQLSDNESYLDISEAFHTDDSDGSSDEESSSEISCFWTLVLDLDYRLVAGHRLLRFFWKYDRIACSLLYSLLIGRTVVISGSESSRQKVCNLIKTLTPLVPISKSHPLNKLSWHCGILVSSHIVHHQVIGLCVPERLSIHEMISPKNKNQLSILDIETKQFFGPAYSGHLLSSLGKVIPKVTSDQGLQLYLQYVAASISELVLVYEALLSKHSDGKPSAILKELQLQSCDADIVKFFSSLSM